MSRLGFVVLLFFAACASQAPVATQSADVVAPQVQPADRTATPRLEVPGPLAEVPAQSKAAVSEYTLASGMRLVVVEHHARPVVSIRLNFAGGSLSDPARNPGATYFAVSLLGDMREVDDSDKRIVGEISVRRKALEQGGVYSDYVGWDASGIGIDGYSADTAKHLQLLANAVLRPRHGERFMELRQRSNIHALEEVEVQNAVSYETELKRAAFGHNHPYGRSVYGTIRSLKKINLDAVITQQRRLVRPAGATLLVVGDVKPITVLTWAQKAFGEFRGRARLKRARIKKDKLRKARPIVIARPRAASLGLCAARPLMDIDADDATLQLLVTWLGEGLHSPILRALRLQEGISYSSSAWLLQRRHGRALLICTQVREEHAERATEVLLAALKAAYATPPSLEDITRARAAVSAKHRVGHDSVQASVDTWLRALRLGQPRPTAETSQATPAELQRLAEEILAPDSLRIVYSGNPAAARRAVAKTALGELRIVR